MNVQTITVAPEYAIAKLKEFRGVAIENRRKEDADFRRLYRAASKGKPILDVAIALKSTGLSENGYPKLAIARADWKMVYFRKWYRGFSSKQYGRNNHSNTIFPPGGTYPEDALTNHDLMSPVPFIPPLLRPKDDLEKYYILFEAQDWKEYPADPFLLKQITGWLFVVEAEWELTELERSLLNAMR
jgi:hypothetical protein